MTIPADYPFKEDLKRFQEQFVKTSTRKATLTIETQTLSLEETIMYSNTPTSFFTKLFQHKAMLNDLSFAACKLLIHICTILDKNDTAVHLTSESTGLNDRTFAKAMLELTHARLLRKAPKRAMYWINLTIVANGDMRETEIDSGKEE